MDAANALSQNTVHKGRPEQIRFCDIAIIFMIGCVLGVIIEGVYCVFAYGEWQTHVTYMWGPFNIVYGAGAAVIYSVSILTAKKSLIIQFLYFCL